MCLIIAGAVSQSQVLAETNEFTSSELKEIRFLSRALIRSRANEKIKIDKELEPERKRIENIQNTLQALESAQVKAMRQVKLESANNLTKVTQVKLNGKTISHHSSLNKYENKIHKFKHKSSLRLSKARSKLTAERVKVEDELPSAFRFWKKKTHKDKRNEHVIKVIKNIETKLSNMQVAESVGLAEITALKEQLILQKPDLSTEELEPTFHTITKHRK